MSKPTDFILETRGLTKEFAGFFAVRDVDLRVRRGSIHALIGPNGAGKTTCFNLLTKFLKPSAGRSCTRGRTSRAGAGRRRAPRPGALVPDLRGVSASDRARECPRRAAAPAGSSFDFWRSKSVLDRFNDRAIELLDDVGLERVCQHAGGRVPYGRKRALEIATTLALDPEMMLLDEPMAGMGHEDIDRSPR